LIGSGDIKIVCLAIHLSDKTLGMPSTAKSQATAKLARQSQTGLIQSVKLGDVFKAVPKPKYILGTTYTLSLAFFESIVFPCLERTALKSCLIIADSFGYGRALEERPLYRVRVKITWSRLLHCLAVSTRKFGSLLAIRRL